VSETDFIIFKKKSGRYHDDDVSVAELLVTGSDDGVIAVWSLADQQLVYSLIGHTVLESSAHCLSLAADGSLRRWSLTSGKQLLCIQEAMPVDSAPSTSHLHVSKQLMFVYTNKQVKAWRLDGSDLLSSSDGGLLVLGVLEDSVVSLSDSGRVRVFNPLSGAPALQTQLVTSPRRVTPVKSVTLPKRGKVFLVSEEGLLYQGSQTDTECV
uniref:Neurobeachin beta-propeller domain-containing protein n=1 Tax=Labrus bergylta TaxID=56723 RepID=A0A3Q3GWF9_9LABR